MALLSKQDLISAFTRLGELATRSGTPIDLLLIGGSLMVLHYQTRQSTRDVDVVIISPPEADEARRLARVVAAEFAWPEDWLNDAAKGFVVGSSPTSVVFRAPGVVVRRPAAEQLLAMKLCAWRDDIDIADARHLLQQLNGNRSELWTRIVPFLQPGRELKAKLAFDDLWEESHGQY